MAKPKKPKDIGLAEEKGTISSKRIELKLDKITSQLQDLAKSQEFLSSKYDELIDTVKEFSRSNKKIKQEIETVKKRNIDMNLELSQLKAKVNAMEQHALNNNVVIRGIGKGNDPAQMVQKIADAIGVKIVGNVQSHEVLIANNQVIIAKFADLTSKIDFIKTAKKKKINTRTMGFDDESNPIYVDEQLTKDTYKLFARAKQLKKIGIKYIWVANGQILIRETDEAKVTKILSECQVTELEKRHALTSKAKRTSNKPAAHTHAKKKNQMAKHDEKIDESTDDEDFTDAN